MGMNAIYNVLLLYIRPRFCGMNFAICKKQPNAIGVEEWVIDWTPRKKCYQLDRVKGKQL